MKNILAENMLRFGVKNLSESNVNKINEALLTEEVVDLKSDPRLPKVAKSLAVQYNKGVAFPVEAMGQYIFRSTTQRKSSEDNPWVDGTVLSFLPYNYGGVGTAVAIQYWPQGWGGRFSYKSDSQWPEFGDVVEFNTDNLNINNAKFSPEKVAEQLNLVNQLPMNVVNAAWTANPNKANLTKTMSSFAASPTGKIVMNMLQGNAKAFYSSMLTAPAGPAAPGTPAPKKQN